MVASLLGCVRRGDSTKTNPSYHTGTCAKQPRKTIPYNKDIESALRSLQQQVFKRGDFLGAEHTPESIEEALVQMGETGTRSILDIAGIAKVERVGFAAPFSMHELRDYFGTTNPTRETVLQSDKFWESIPRGCCRFLVVASEGEPTEILFVGSVFD